MPESKFKASRTSLGMLAKDPATAPRGSNSSSSSSISGGGSSSNQPTATGNGVWGILCPCCKSRPSTLGSASPSATSSSSSHHLASPAASPSNSAANSRACCCGMSLLVVVRLSFVIALVACIIVGVFFFDDMKHYFLDTLLYVRELGPLRGSIVLCIANILGALLFMPCVPFTLGAGFLYGTFVGSIVVSIASTVAAVIAFLTARYLARKWIEKSLGGKGSKFRILDNAINQDGFRIVLLIRSSPLHPYGVCNYLFGLTSVTGHDYTVASFIGMLPATIMEVYLGASLKTVSDIINGTLDNSMLSRVFFWGGLIVSIIVTALITVLLKRKLKSEMEKYSVVSTNESDVTDDEMTMMDEFGMGGEEESVSTHLPEALDAHDHALSDTDSQLSVSVSINSGAAANGLSKGKLDSSISIKTKAKSLSKQSERKLSASSDSTGSSNRRSTAKPLTKLAKPIIVKPPSGSSTPIHASSPNARIQPASVSASSTASPKQPFTHTPPKVTAIAPPPAASVDSPLSPPVSHHVDEEEKVSESESLIANKEV